MRRLALLSLLPLLMGADAVSPPSDACARHAEALRAMLPGFTVLVAQPFVVAGDDSPDRVKASADLTVKWAVAHLKKDFFEKDPPEILDIYLFKDRLSYQRHTRELFGESPDTPYGYYSPGHKALIMNIATGGGTLVHEIVHPYMAANFPKCPPWFNEGLGSLFEQSAERDGHIVGLTNWRLAGLQAAIRAKKVPPFSELCVMDLDTFYTKDRGTNYSQARYLLFYLQEKGLLRKYYQEFVRNQEKDPGGYTTLQSVLGEEDIPAFQKRWESWVLTLHFP